MPAPQGGPRGCLCPHGVSQHCLGWGHGSPWLCFIVTLLPPVARFEENQSGVAEMEEFLPHGTEKKQTHFTDVSISAGTAVAVGRGQLLV